MAESEAEPKDGDAFSYSAFFDSLLKLEDPVTQAVKAFAEKHEARATLVHSGAPFSGVVCRIDISPLTAQGVSDFRAQFSPTRDTDIPFL